MALSDDSAAGSSDSTLRVDQFDCGQVVAEQSSHKISTTGASTLSCKALPALVTHEGCSMTLAATKDPPLSGFKDEHGQPRAAAFYPHKSGGCIAEMAGGWMRNVIGPCFAVPINQNGEHVVGLGDGLAVRVPHSSHRTQPENRKLFQPFKAIARSKIDFKIGQNILKGKGAQLTDKQRRQIFNEGWEEAFSVQNMRSSWAETGFREDAVHGFVCDRKCRLPAPLICPVPLLRRCEQVFWDLVKEERRAATAKAAAGAPVNLSYNALTIGPSGGADAEGESSSSSDEDEQDKQETAVAETGGDGQKNKQKRRRVLSSGDFLEVGPITYGKGKEMLDARNAAADKKQEEKRQKAQEEKEEELARLRQRKELAREGAHQLWKSRGNFKALAKNMLRTVTRARVATSLN
eukprot:2371677-Prymnesium_polylepis.2